MEQETLTAIGEQLFKIEGAIGAHVQTQAKETREAVDEIRRLISRMNRPATGDATRDSLLDDLSRLITGDGELRARLERLDAYSLSILRELVELVTQQTN